MISEEKRALQIIFQYRVDIDDLVESENYDDYAKKTEEYFDKVVAPLNTVTKEWWLKRWLISEEDYNFLREVSECLF